MCQVAHQHRLHKYTTLFLSILCIDILITYYIYMRGDTGNKKTYYILRWKMIGIYNPLRFLGTGSSKFIEMNCPYQNCYVTDNKNFLLKITDFDAIIFSGRSSRKYTLSYLPQQRSPSQKYIFALNEPVPMFLTCNPLLENFFNWTWTHKLSSDIRWSYVLIYDLHGNEVGPKQNMTWPTEMTPIKDKKTKAILDGKSKAAAWFVSHCDTFGRREKYVKVLKPELASLNLILDVYGDCGNLSCPVGDNKCNELVKADYYFYFSFENSITRDYVTEKLLTALLNYAVPVVYGGADYTRFLPPGSYLDAHNLRPIELARTMKEIIQNKTRYYDFFRWRNHFVYKHGENASEICNVCTALNKNIPTNLNLRDGFRFWWAGEYKNSLKRCMRQQLTP
ncbi:alpha-(1,3)-fucosyltransferase C-like isoform X2 [Plodia interpunctella]|uniref:alpha-(1,3)-fucosyltransferase C-like isoform X2 n=1 Tax=Plodia interpunctella TaxID=58824 RepID=UPI002368BFA3|nr:alpha-(1,3)-fucosyltransferase C-like isoform X2 [Plodia interpunctella]